MVFSFLADLFLRAPKLLLFGDEKLNIVSNRMILKATISFIEKISGSINIVSMLLSTLCTGTKTSS